MEMGMYSEALKAVRQALQNSQGRPSFIEIEIDLLELLNEPLEALEILAPLTHKDPHNPILREKEMRLQPAVERRLRAEAEIRDIKEEIGAPVPHISCDQSFLDVFVSRFGGREGVHAVQSRSKDLSWGYRPERESLTAIHIKRHISGDCTLGTYLLKRDNTSSLMVIDLDIAKNFLPRFEKDPLERNRLKRLLTIEAARLHDAAAEAGIPLLLESSGFKGLHIWAFSDPSIPARYWRSIGQWLLERLPAPRRELKWELFPKQDSIDSTGYGNLVKIPLGIHRRSGKRSLFLSREDFKPFADQTRAFLEHPCLGKEEFEHILGNITLGDIRVIPGKESREEFRPGFPASGNV